MGANTEVAIFGELMGTAELVCIAKEFKGWEDSRECPYKGSTDLKFLQQGLAIIKTFSIC